MRPTLTVILLLASASAYAAPFEFGGLSRATTWPDIASRYPNSSVSGSFVHVSPKDTHDHVYGIGLAGPDSRFRINFESPERKYPPCKDIEARITMRHGKPAQVREFREEQSQNRYLSWKLEGEVVELQCFRMRANVPYVVEAIVVNTTEPAKRAP